MVTDDEWPSCQTPNAHSMFSPPMARRNLLSSFMTSEPAEAGAIPVSTDGAQDPPRDAKSAAQ